MQTSRDRARANPTRSSLRLLQHQERDALLNPSSARQSWFFSPQREQDLSHSTDPLSKEELFKGFLTRKEERHSQS